MFLNKTRYMKYKKHNYEESIIYKNEIIKRLIQLKKGPNGRNNR
jgi:hypothetical protein